MTRKKELENPLKVYIYIEVKQHQYLKSRKGGMSRRLRELVDADMAFESFAELHIPDLFDEELKS